MTDRRIALITSLGFALLAPMFVSGAKQAEGPSSGAFEKKHGGPRKVAVERYFRDEVWAKVGERLRQGEALSKPLEGSDLMPQPVVQMIKAGEASGQLGVVLDRLCDFLDNELRTTIKGTTQLIEPIMIAVMGAVVGGIAIALLLPIMTISKVISN